MQYFSQTRGEEKHSQITFKDCILQPRASFGGLYTLLQFQPLQLESLVNLDYINLSKKIFSHLGLELDGLEEALQSYKGFDNPSNPAPISHLHHRFYLQELYHGPSRAFKDMALQPLGRLFQSYAKGKYLLLVATSGDTGPATLESFGGMENIQVVCLYPAKGTSDVQRLQMSTQHAKNLKVLPIIGNFDDAQRILKSLLCDEDFLMRLKQRGIEVSASNSVNFGRIAFQIVYHIWGYLCLVREKQIALGEKIYSVIPSGNFGNALGAFYAKLMGLPVHKIIIASNPNNILTDFIQSGVYDISSRSLLQTQSPAMDILKSSNVERVLFALFGSERTKELMGLLDKRQCYKLTQKELEVLREHFDAGFCDDSHCLKQISLLAKDKKIIDPHTAVAYAVAQTLGGEDKVLICSTAEWSKFSPTIAYAIEGKTMSDQEAIAWVSSSFGLPVAKQIASLFEKPEIHTQALHPDEIREAILRWCGGIL